MDSKTGRNLSLHTIVTTKQKDALYKLLEREDTDFDKVDPYGMKKTAEMLAEELTKAELENAPSYDIVYSDKAQHKEKNTKEERAQEFYQFASLLTFSRLAKKLILSDGISQRDARDFDYLQSPPSPFHHMKFNAEELSKAWLALIKQPTLNEKRHAFERVAYLFDAYLGTHLTATILELKDDKHPCISNPNLSYLDLFFEKACNLQNSKLAIPTTSLHRRPHQSDARYKKLGEIRAAHDNQFKQHLNQKGGLEKIDLLLKTLGHPLIHRRRNGSSGKSKTAQYYCETLLRELKQMSPNMKKSTQWLPLLQQSLNHPIVKTRRQGEPGQSAEWKEIEIIWDYSSPAENYKSQLIAGLKRNIMTMTSEQSEKKAMLCEIKSRRLNGPDRWGVGKYLRQVTEFREMAKISRFAELARQFIIDEAMTSEKMRKMDELRKHIPSDLPSVWTAIISPYVTDEKRTVAIQKTAFLFDCYFGTSLQKIKIQEKKSPFSFMPSLNDFFKVACQPYQDPFQRGRYHQLGAIRKTLDNYFKNQIALKKTDEEKITFLLDCLKQPALHKRRNGDPGKSTTAHRYCHEIVNILKKNETLFLQCKEQKPEDRMASLDKWVDMLGAVLNNNTFRLPLHGEKRDSSIALLVEEMRRTAQDTQVKLSDKTLKATGHNMRVFKPTPEGHRTTYTSLGRHKRGGSP